MGQALSYIGFRGINPEQAQQRLKLMPTTVNVGLRDAPIVAALTPSEWYVVIFNDFQDFAKKKLAELSVGCELFYGFTEEHVMASLASSWRGSSEQWTVAHDGDIGVDNLRVVGVPPKEFETIRAEKRAMQEADPEDDVDYIFEIPHELTKVVLGFTPDTGIIDRPDYQFEALKAAKSKGVFSFFR